MTQHDPRAEMLAKLLAQAHQARTGQAPPSTSQAPPATGDAALLGADPDLRLAMMRLQRQLAEASQWKAKGAVHHFTLAVTDYTAAVLLPKLMPKLKKDAPLITFEIAPLTPDTLAESLNDGTHDLAMAPSAWMPPASAGLATQPLFEDRFVCVARAEHPLAQGAGTLSPQDLVGGSSQVVLPEGIALEGDPTPEPIGVRQFLETSEVKQSDVLITLPKRLLDAFDRRKELVSLQPPMPLPSIGMWLIFSNKQRTQPPHVWLRMKIRETLMESSEQQ